MKDQILTLWDAGKTAPYIAHQLYPAPRQGTARASVKRVLDKYRPGWQAENLRRKAAQL